MTRTFILFLLLAAASGCYRHDERTVNIEVPKATQAPCQDHLKRHLQVVMGIQDVQAQPGSSAISITYNARITALRNLEHTIARIGFEVISSNPLEGQDPYVIPASTNGVAQLPPECR